MFCELSVKSLLLLITGLDTLLYLIIVVLSATRSSSLNPAITKYAVYSYCRSNVLMYVIQSYLFLCSH